MSRAPRNRFLSNTESATMSKYLLPCECGKGIAVDVKQAGQQLTCECGKLLDVPTLRGVRALEPVQESMSESGRKAEWDRTRGMLFAGSLLLCVVGALVAYYGYDGLKAAPNITREVEKATFDKSIDELSLDEAYDTWQSIRDHGLGERGHNVFVNIRAFRARRQKVLVAGIVLCVVGAMGGVGSTLGRRKASR